MPNDDLQRFRLQTKTSIEISAELHVKLASHAAALRPPCSAETLMERLIRAELDHAPHKLTFEYRPKRETR